ncbi:MULTISPECIES: hypothetical protein [Pseudomonas]|uniref:Uncharacterized protein n=1 Tax=Pseudomonas kribbensis TaxID=1628086 RepID=A0A4Y8V9Z4_9PSED|nr:MULTISPECIES: hypothetical protein [Pseudomonas]TFH76877.1 hypothetical protein E4J90_27905 [Pseudomonas kribbensis]
MIGTNRKRGVYLLLTMLLLLAMLLALKVHSSLVTKPLKTYMSESGKCYIARYAADYEFLGVAGSLLELFSSQAFYRVYSADGKLLKTSEWYLWMREGDSGVAPEFRGEMILYPGSEGWESWIIPECR